MDIRKIRKLIDLIKEKHIGEIEVREGEESVRISQFGQTASPEFIQSGTKNIVTEPPKASVKTSSESIDENQHIVRSPMIGSFYAAPTPDADSFVTVGQTVKPGDVLCIVEAMKMFNQIESDCHGTIKTCLLENGQPVEYNQPLFIIEK